MKSLKYLTVLYLSSFGSCIDCDEDDSVLPTSFSGNGQAKVHMNKTIDSGVYSLKTSTLTSIICQKDCFSVLNLTVTKTAASTAGELPTGSSSRKTVEALSTIGTPLPSTTFETIYVSSVRSSPPVVSPMRPPYQNSTVLPTSLPSSINNTTSVPQVSSTFQNATVISPISTYETNSSVEEVSSTSSVYGLEATDENEAYEAEADPEEDVSGFPDPSRKFFGSSGGFYGGGYRGGYLGSGYRGSGYGGSGYRGIGIVLSRSAAPRASPNLFIILISLLFI